MRLLANWVNSWKPKLHHGLVPRFQPKAGIVFSYSINKVLGLFLFHQQTPLIFLTSDRSNEKNTPSNDQTAPSSNEQTTENLEESQGLVPAVRKLPKSGPSHGNYKYGGRKNPSRATVGVRGKDKTPRKRGEAHRN